MKHLSIIALILAITSISFSVIGFSVLVLNHPVTLRDFKSVGELEAFVAIDQTNESGVAKPGHYMNCYDVAKTLQESAKDFGLRLEEVYWTPEQNKKYLGWDTGNIGHHVCVAVVRGVDGDTRYFIEPSTDQIGWLEGKGY